MLLEGVKVPGEATPPYRLTAANHQCALTPLKSFNTRLSSDLPSRISQLDTYPPLIHTRGVIFLTLRSKNFRGLPMLITRAMETWSYIKGRLLFYELLLSLKHHECLTFCQLSYLKSSKRTIAEPRNSSRLSRNT